MFVSSTESVVSAGIVFDSGKKNKLKLEFVVFVARMFVFQSFYAFFSLRRVFTIVITTLVYLSFASFSFISVWLNVVQKIKIQG